MLTIYLMVDIHPHNLFEYIHSVSLKFRLFDLFIKFTHSLTCSLLSLSVSLSLSQNISIYSWGFFINSKVLYKFGVCTLQLRFEIYLLVLGFARSLRGLILFLLILGVVC